ncbi:hypothetical protein SCLARK_001574 [Spiroplasma clarkii]|nr:hypothetical protein SCLARK_001574 [Spiroplasma clarkii]
MFTVIFILNNLLVTFVLFKILTQHFLDMDFKDEIDYQLAWLGFFTLALLMNFLELAFPKIPRFCFFISYWFFPISLPYLILAYQVAKKK